MYDPAKPYKKQILNLIQQTWETPYVSVRDGIVKKKFPYKEYHHTDGIGTKGVYHLKQRSFENAVTDAMAMNLNDLALKRAIPYAIIDHLFLPQDDENAILEIIGYLVKECKKRDIAITGGETAIHDNMEGLEISITILGFVKKPKSNKFQAGDALIGIESNGLHSNGFTKVREVFGDEYRSEFIRPTNIYLDTILDLDEKYDIHGMMHITGGAYNKLIDLLDDSDAYIRRDHKLEPQLIFRELYEKGIDDKKMYKTFNCGTGFILSSSPKECEIIISEISDFNADIIGEIIPGNNKVRIKSKFSNKKIEL